MATDALLSGALPRTDTARAARVLSIDVFRGLTMLVMIFVNDLDSVKGLPWWTYHRGRVNGMTYVDMVFPAFLFIVGMSIPLAVRHRLARTPSIPLLWWHVLTRSFSLVVLGIALANSEKGSEQWMHMSQGAWTLLVLLGAVLFWNVYPPSIRYRLLFRVLKFSGVVLMVAMFAMFRRVTESGQVAWLDLSYWEILGLIGWTYLAVCILYIPTRTLRWASWLWCAALVILNIASIAGWLRFPEQVPFYLWPFNNGAFCSMTMAGVLISTLFLSDTVASSFKAKAVWALGCALVFLVAAWLLEPLGLSKIRATPSWSLYCSGASTIIFLLLYWICDVKKKTSWAAFVKPAGSNTLLTYLLPDFFYAALGSSAVFAQFERGVIGVGKSIVFTAFILLLSAILTRCRLRLQL